MNLESAWSLANLSRASSCSFGLSAPLMASIKVSSSVPTATENLGQGCWAKRGKVTIPMASMRKAQERLCIETSRSGRNPYFGCPPEMRREPWDRPPIIFVLGTVWVQEFALLKRCEDVIQQDAQKCQQKNHLRPGQESHAQDHQH